ncbi:MAG: ABC transporter ATP-binding protein [Phycisphaeraceae bacterium]
MNAFWGFARQMLHYRRLIALGFTAALIDAASAFGGFAALLWIIDQFFGDDQPMMRETAAQWLAGDHIERFLGDVTHWAQIIPASPFGGMAFMLGVVLTLAIIGSVMRYVYQASMLTVVLRTIMRIRKNAYQHLIHAPLEVQWKHGSADHINRVVRDCTQLSKGLMALMGRAVRDVLMGGAFLLLAVIVDWQLTAMFLVAVAAIYVVIRKFGKRIRKASRRAFRAFGWMTGAMQEALQGGAAVKVHNAEGYERRRFNTINRQVLKQELRARTVRALASPVTELIAIAGVIAVSLVATHIVLNDPARDPTNLLNVLLPLAMAGNSVRPLARLNNDLQESAAAAERVAEVMTLPVESNVRRRRAGAGRGRALARHHTSVRFEGVTYRYPDQPEPAVCNVSMAVQHEQKVAIVGANGSGKSTLLSLLPRLVEPQAGRVLIDGVDIAEVSLRSLRGQMALVSQQTVLFGGTVAQNIAYGMRHASAAAIERAAKQAHAHEFIVNLPAGYDAVLGEGGSGLSGGQRQRLALARAILRDPAILMLDEATSQVDTESEAKIGQALAAVQKGRTTFVIAHRLSTVRDADMVVVMEFGRIIDVGTHAALEQRCEAYRTLAAGQLRSQAASVAAGK